MVVSQSSLIIYERKSRAPFCAPAPLCEIWFQKLICIAAVPYISDILVLYKKRGSHLVPVIKFYVSILLCISPQKNKKSELRILRHTAVLLLVLESPEKESQDDLWSPERMWPIFEWGLSHSLIAVGFSHETFYSVLSKHKCYFFQQMLLRQTFSWSVDFLARWVNKSRTPISKNLVHWRGPCCTVDQINLFCKSHKSKVWPEGVYWPNFGNP